MESTGDILKRLIPHDKKMYEALASEKLALLWPQVAEGEMQLYVRIADYKNGILFVETPSPAWAHQILFVKNIIIEKYKALVPRILIHDIKSRVAADFVKPEAEAEKQVLPEVHLADEVIDDHLRETLNEIIAKDHVFKEHDTRPICPLCDSRYEGSGSICSHCAELHLKKDDVKIQRYLEDTPWSRYQDMMADHPTINEERYHAVKQTLINKIQDKVMMLYFANRNEKVKKHMTDMRRYAYTLVSLRTGLPPDQLTPAIMQEKIGGRLWEMVSK